MLPLYGDGLHDDTKALQERIDTAGCELILPAPSVCYLISEPLSLPSCFRLVLPRFAEVRLAPHSDCYMLTNKLERNPDFVPSQNESFFTYLGRYRADRPCENIEIRGGIWNHNNLEQSPNPLCAGLAPGREYNGHLMLFYNVKNLKISDLTLKDPVNFSVSLDTVSCFTVENLTFDFNYGNCQSICMDGVHVYGNCHFGVIRNLKGACRDDLVALNADEGSCGPISDIEIDGIFADICHSAVRLLTHTQPVERVHITNVFGTFYQYGIGFTISPDDGWVASHERTGYFDAITLDNLYIAKSTRYAYTYPYPDAYVYPLIYVESGLILKNVCIRDLHRREYQVAVDTMFIAGNTTVDHLTLQNVSTENHTGKSFPLLHNESHIRVLRVDEIRSDGGAILENIGQIDEIRGQALT